MNQRGQALIEALAGVTCLIVLIASFAYVLVVCGTRLILDNEVDRLALCLASEKRRSCVDKSRQRLRSVAPWVKAQEYQGHYQIGFSGFGEVRASLFAVTRFQTLTINHGSLEWSPIKIEITRSFREQEMKADSLY